MFFLETKYSSATMKDGPRCKLLSLVFVCVCANRRVFARCMVTNHISLVILDDMCVIIHVAVTLRHCVCTLYMSVVLVI